VSALRPGSWHCSDFARCSPRIDYTPFQDALFKSSNEQKRERIKYTDKVARSVEFLFESFSLKSAINNDLVYFYFIKLIKNRPEPIMHLWNWLLKEKNRSADILGIKIFSSENMIVVFIS